MAEPGDGSELAFEVLGEGGDNSGAEGEGSSDESILLATFSVADPAAMKAAAPVTNSGASAGDRAQGQGFQCTF